MTKAPSAPRAVAYYGAVAGIGASIGLVLGGVITDALSWRVAFFINVPIGLAMVLAAPRFLPETERRAGQLDVARALCATLGMTALVYGLVRSAEQGWSDSGTIFALAIGVVLLVAFVGNERRAAQPIMPLRLFDSAERSAAYREEHPRTYRRCWARCCDSSEAAASGGPAVTPARRDPRSR